MASDSGVPSQELAGNDSLFKDILLPAGEEKPNEVESAIGSRPPVENERFKLAKTLIWITFGLGVAVLAAVLVGSFWVPNKDAWERFEKLATLVLVQFQTLVGIAIGWYFGERKASG
ncbi:hypothetical protein [Pengzhenrongella sp.]|jgi:hypothetical protein|uniref:hypothetical protein n=1 Tax=Pengzhenrongella sp. TaxID=2888820 RepID=UPI002F935B32